MIGSVHCWLLRKKSSRLDARLLGTQNSRTCGEPLTVYPSIKDPQTCTVPPLPIPSLSVVQAIAKVVFLRVVYALLIINKAGGLIYQRDFAPGLTKLSTNDYLVLAGTFHGVHAITTRLHPLSSHGLSQNPSERPEPPSGIEVLESENFRLQCIQTLTGTKFLLFTEPQMPNTDRIMGRIYELYADYVMKNPFYQLEMPVRSGEWERRLGGYLRPLNSR